MKIIAGESPKLSIRGADKIVAKDFWCCGVFLDRESNTTHFMKKQLCSITLSCLLAGNAYSQSFAPAPGAPPTAPAPAAIPVRALKNAEGGPIGNDTPKLARFNLNFPGGTPHELVAAIEKAMGKPLNIIIPDEYANESIPALKMNQVNVSDLFRAMEQASVTIVPYRTASYGGGSNRSYSYQQLRTSLTFQTSGPLTDESVWYFRGREKAPDPSIWGETPAPVVPKTSRFYALTPYLEQGLKVEDITTAVQTAWKMLGEKETPSISFHKETKLLIAVGEPSKLETIDAVLKALSQKSAIDPATGLPIDPYARMDEIHRRAAAPVATPVKSPASPKSSSTPVNEP